MPLDVYRMLIKSLRDQDSEKQILKRFLTGFQGVYERAWNLLDSMRYLFSSLTPLRGDKLWFPLATLGVTWEVFVQMEDYQRRRLIDYLIPLWHQKGIKAGLIPSFAAITGARLNFDEHFDFRWIESEKASADENYAVSNRDIDMTDLYVETVMYQTIIMVTQRLGAGLLRTQIKDIPDIVILSGDTLCFDLYLLGPDFHSCLDVKLHGAGWLSELGTARFETGHWLSTAENFLDGGGVWLRMKLGLSDFIGDQINALGLIQGDSAHGTFETRVRRIFLQRADGTTIPFLMHPSGWSKTAIAQPTDVYYEIQSLPSFEENWELFRAITNELRPLGAIYKLHAVLEKFLDFRYEANRIMLTADLTVDTATGALEFPAAYDPGAPTGMAATRKFPYYLGLADYGISIRFSTDGSTPEIRFQFCCQRAGSYYEITLDVANRLITVSQILDSVTVWTTSTTLYGLADTNRLFVYACHGTVYVQQDGSVVLSYVSSEDPLSGPWKLFGQQVKVNEISVLQIPSYHESITGYSS